MERYSFYFNLHDICYLAVIFTGLTITLFLWLSPGIRQAANRLLSLASLAEKLGLHTHELSRIINTVFKKSFNELINEYRVVQRP